MRPEKKFLSRIVKNINDKGCWYFKSDDGSGFKTEFYLNKKRFRVKKFSYEHFVGKAKSGLKILCKCGDKLCINPKHHFEGSAKDQFRLLYQRGWRHQTGHKLSSERIAALSKLHKGKIISQELRERLKQANLGNKHTIETRQKMSQSRMGLAVKEEARKKIAESKQGQKNWNTRLTPKDILKIRKLAATLNSSKKKKRGELTILDIAERFGISQVHVINIHKRKVWKHLK